MIVATASVTLAIGVTVAALTGYLRPREAPAVDTAVEVAPLELAPVEVAPVEAAPVAPVEVVPVELAPVEDTPAVLAVYQPAQADDYEGDHDDDEDDEDDEDEDDEDDHDEHERRGHHDDD